MKLNKTIYALSMAGMLGLWSCTSDEAMPDSNIASGERVPITIEVSHGGDVQTRTDLSEDLQEGGLTHTWAAGDEVVFYNSNGQEAGKLTLQEGEGTSKGIFTGTVTAESGKYHLWYFGRPQAAADASSADRYPYLDFSEAGKVKLNFANQNFKSVDDLTAVDVLSQDVDIIVKGEKGYVEKSIFMNPHVAMARFKVSGLPEGTTGTLKITNKLTSINSSGNLVYQIYYKHPMLLSGSGDNAGGNSTTSNGFSYENVTNGSDIYVAFIPNAYELIFEFTSNTGNKYSYTFGNNNIEAGVYYQSFTEGENGNDGKSDGISIPLQPDNNEVKLVYHANFEGANPATYEETMSSTSGQTTFTVKSYQNLIKDNKLPSRDNYISFGWSKTENGDIEDLSTIEANGNESTIDLYAVWTDQSKNPLSKWAESDLTRSAQEYDARAVETGSWRETGSFFQFGRNIGFNGWREVLNNPGLMDVAKMNSNWTGGSFYASGYGIVNGTNLVNVYVGSGNATKAWWYTSSTEISKYPNDFYFAGNQSLGSWNGDYVFDSSIRLKHTWAERAEYCGYNYPSPCPDGYRLPKIEDWRKILPSGGHTYSSGATNNFPVVAEIKNISNENLRYAIRWSRYVENSIQYLKIESCVLPESINDMESISSDVWNDSNVALRHFKGAGMILPQFFLAQLNYNGHLSYQWVARPMPLCEFNYGYKVVSGGATTNVNIIRDDTNLGGCYWVDDPSQSYVGFRFDPNNYQQQGSYINVFHANVPVACNIRCIKNN